MNAIVMYRIERWLYFHHLTILAKIVRGGYFCCITALSPIPVKSEKVQNLDIKAWAW